VLGDRAAVRRLVIIFIDNAIKYSSPGSDILISVDADQAFATVEVKDEGIGIADQDLPHILERFYRADKARSREMGGVGLGLSIAKWIADAHRARIEVESHLGKGSSFRAVFPVSYRTLSELISEGVVGRTGKMMRLNSPLPIGAGQRH